MWHVYILQCIDGSLYTGASNNLKKRFLDHKDGKGGRYTRSHKVVRLLYSEKLLTKSDALKREIEIKAWSKAEKIRNLKLF